MQYFRISLTPTDHALQKHEMICSDFRAINIKHDLVALSFIADCTIDDTLTEYYYICLDESQLDYFLPFLQKYEMTLVPKPTQGWFVFSEGAILAYNEENLNSGKEFVY